MEGWNQYNFRSLWQHPVWAAFQRAAGREVFTAIVDGASALLIKRPLPFGLSWLELPRGPLFESQKALEEIMKKIEEVANKEKAVFVRMSSYDELTLKDKRIHETPFDHHPTTSLVVDLEASEEDILSQMKPKGRYNIKVAQKHDVRVEPSNDVEAFHHLLKKTGGRDGFGIHEIEYYKNMLQAMGQHAELLLAHYEDRVIAGGIFVYLDEWGIYYYGASDHNYRTMMAPYLIQWEAMLKAKNQGCKHFDFLGIAPENVPNHPWTGVTEFKKKFGGRVVDYPTAKDLVLKPIWYIIYQMRKKMR